jgi:hypothetical protein
MKSTARPAVPKGVPAIAAAIRQQINGVDPIQAAIALKAVLREVEGRP